VGDVEPSNTDLAGLAVDLDFGDCADISGQQIILGVADTSSCGDIVLEILVPRGSWLPASVISYSVGASISRII
jgi:hypothetical protein